MCVFLQSIIKQLLIFGKKTKTELIICLDNLTGFEWTKTVNNNNNKNIELLFLFN